MSLQMYTFMLGLEYLPQLIILESCLTCKTQHKLFSCLYCWQMLFLDDPIYVIRTYFIFTHITLLLTHDKLYCCFQCFVFHYIKRILYHYPLPCSSQGLFMGGIYSLALLTLSLAIWPALVNGIWVEFPYITKKTFPPIHMLK